jgi:hypothetical protein
MRRGAGKQKGGAFERLVCKDLSRWVTSGRREDVFWRSAMSGGRATTRLVKGKRSPHVSGDICAVHHDGNRFMDYFYVECKIYRLLDLHRVAFGCQGNLLSFWETTKQQASNNGKMPMLIAKQNLYPPILVLGGSGVLFLRAGDLLMSTCPKIDAHLLMWQEFRDATNIVAILNEAAPLRKRPSLSLALPAKLNRAAGIARPVLITPS